MGGHPPGAFAFGPAGASGQLALAVLADALGDDDRARSLHRQFHRDFVARADGDVFEVTGEQVRAWADRVWPARSLDAAAEVYLDALEAVTPDSPDEFRRVEREAGWAEAIGHFARTGTLTPDGLVEAQKILAAGTDWLRELAARDGDLPPTPKL